ncbi:hypothetical protein PENSPDRAFT_679940 [Peniophora sp. CONT]|nr:hypothetical protein PENSPDRAFT_679940 [Peniophora sp. CONT]
MSTATMLPPGLEGDLVEVESGGSGDWMTFEKRKWYTNALIFDPSGLKVLLGLKKRGMGIGLYNGFGGKLELGETAAEAAARELKEEAGIDAPLEHCGSLLFVTEDEALGIQIELYRASSYNGDIAESDEMIPQWFATTDLTAGITPTGDDALPAIPYEQMYQETKIWVPLILSGKHIVGRIDFVPNASVERKYDMRRWWFGVPSASQS